MPVTPDRYTASSNPVSAGMPSWVPPVGVIRDVSLNTLSSQRGTDDAGWTRAIFNAWSGMAVVEQYGDLGSVIATGGGHGDGAANAVYRFDLATRLWSKIKQSATPFNVGGNVADPATGWMYADASGSTLQVGQPFAAHHYSGLVGVPPSAIPGGRHGWLLSAGRIVQPFAAGPGTSKGLKLNLGDELFSHHGGDFGNTGAVYGGSCWDSARNRLVAFTSYNIGYFSWLDLATAVNGNTNFNGGNYYDAYECAAFYDASSDLYYVIQVKAPYRLLICTPTGVVVTAVTTGTAPTAFGGWDWVEEWGCLVFFTGLDNIVWTLSRPVNPLTGTWVWNSQTLTGTVNQRLSTVAHYTRFRWFKKIKSFIWCATTESAAQIARIRKP